MDYKQEIQYIIKHSLKNISAQKNKVISEQKKLFDDLDMVMAKIEKVVLNEKELSALSEKELDLITPFLDDSNKDILNAYRIFLRSQYLVLEEKLAVKLKSICEDVVHRYNLYKREAQENDMKLSELVSFEQKLENLKIKLIDYKITAEDLDIFNTLFITEELPVMKRIELLIFISNEYMKKINIDELLNVEFSISDQGIEEEKLVQLFSNYNYDFYQLNKRSREKLQKEGNLQNITEILETFSKYNIDLNQTVNSVLILNCRSNQLSEIFVHSNATLIENLLYSIEKANLLSNGKFVLVDLIKSPSIFISRTKPYKLRKNEKSGGDYDISTYGCNQDFIENLKLLRQKYDEVALKYPNNVDEFYKMYEKCSSMLKKSNVQILNAIRVYDLYNISPEEYLNALSGLNSLNQADVFDVAIELDCFDYVKQNMSRAMLNINDRIFNNIAIARVKAFSDDDIFRVVERHTLFTTKKGLQIRDSYLEKVTAGKQFNKFNIYENDRFSEQDKAVFNQIEKILSNSNNFDISLSMAELNNSNLNGPLNKLENYVSQDDSSVYVFYDIRISKMKVLRLYNTLRQNNINININVLIYILTKNSYLNQYQFNTICDEIEDLFQKEKSI